MVDLFQEVEEELRSDNFRTVVRRIAPWAVALFLGVIVAYFGQYGYKKYHEHVLTQVNAEYQKGVDALAANDTTGAYAHFEAASKFGIPAYKALSLAQQAGLRAAAGTPDAAARLYDAAAQASPNPIFADLASLKAAIALLDTAPFPQLQTRLLPLTDSKRPYSVYAKEALAMAKLLAGKTAAARADFSVLTLALGAPDDMRDRAQQAIQLIDAGEVPAAIAAVKAAATLPPPQPASLGPPPQAQGQGAPTSPPAGAAQ